MTYGILFVPEVLLAANAMKAGMFILRPLLAWCWSAARRSTRRSPTRSAPTATAATPRSRSFWCRAHDGDTWITGFDAVRRPGDDGKEEYRLL